MTYKEFLILKPGQLLESATYLCQPNIEPNQPFMFLKSACQESIWCITVLYQDSVLELATCDIHKDLPYIRKHLPLISEIE